MSVLAIHPNWELYGSDRMFLESVRALHDRGFRVITVIPQDGPLKVALDDLGIMCHVIPFPVLRKATLTAARAPGFALEMMRSALHARRQIRHWSPSILYLSTLIAPQWLVAARSLRTPSICHVHELANNVPRAAAKVLYAPLRLATLTIANSEASRNFMVDLHPALRHRSLTIPNGLELPPLYDRKPNSAEKRILVVGRLGHHKGQDVAIEAFAMVINGGCNAVLELAGAVFQGYERYEQALRARANELGIADRVRFLGFRTDVWSLYEQADVVLVPSRTEPFGLVAVEAMAASRPVVASAVGGLADIVRQGVSGWSVAPNDPGQLAAAIKSVLSDPDASWKLARDAAMTARDQYSRERFSRSLLAAFESCGVATAPQS